MTYATTIALIVGASTLVRIDLQGIFVEVLHVA
jgi:hypothetical protein